MATGIDHIVIAVRDLDTTVADYRRAGFTVVPGGEHKDGVTHNALVAFSDGAYFELIAFKNPDVESDHRWWGRLAKGEGLVDYALRTSDLTQEIIDLRTRGLDASEPIDGGRIRPDGQRLDWQTIRFGGASSPALPFYCFDLTDRALRVPQGDDAIHANGITGVSGVTIVTSDIDVVGPQFAALSGTSGERIATATHGVTDAQRFQVGNIWIDVVQPLTRESDLRTVVEHRGDSMYSVTLNAPDGGDTSVPIGLAHGARLVLRSGSYPR